MRSVNEILLKRKGRAFLRFPVTPGSVSHLRVLVIFGAIDQLIARTHGIW